MNLKVKFMQAYDSKFNITNALSVQVPDTALTCIWFCFYLGCLFAPFFYRKKQLACDCQSWHLTYSSAYIWFVSAYVCVCCVRARVCVRAWRAAIMVCLQQVLESRAAWQNPPRWAACKHAQAASFPHHTDTQQHANQKRKREWRREKETRKSINRKEGLNNEATKQRRKRKGGNTGRGAGKNKSEGEEGVYICCVDCYSPVVSYVDLHRGFPHYTSCPLFLLLNYLGLIVANAFPICWDTNK